MGLLVSGNEKMQFPEINLFERRYIAGNTLQFIFSMRIFLRELSQTSVSSLRKKV